MQPPRDRPVPPDFKDRAVPATPPSLSTYVESWSPGPIIAEDPLLTGPVEALSAVLDLPGTAAKADGPTPRSGTGS